MQQDDDEDQASKMLAINLTAGSVRNSHWLYDFMVPFFPLVRNVESFVKSRDLGFVYEYLNRPNKDLVITPKGTSATANNEARSDEITKTSDNLGDIKLYFVSLIIFSKEGYLEETWKRIVNAYKTYYARINSMPMRKKMVFVTFQLVAAGSLVAIIITIFVCRSSRKTNV